MLQPNQTYTPPEVRALQIARNALSRRRSRTSEFAAPAWREDYAFYGVNKAFQDEAKKPDGYHTIVLSGPNDTGKTITSLSLLHEIALNNPGVEW